MTPKYLQSGQGNVQAVSDTVILVVSATMVICLVKLLAERWISSPLVASGGVTKLEQIVLELF